MDENNIIKSVEHFNSSLVAKYMYDGMRQILMSLYLKIIWFKYFLHKTITLV